MVDLDKEIELYKSKVAFYESQNTRGEYAVTVRELKFVVETLEALRSERSQGDLISREALKEKAIWTKVNNGAELIDIEVVPLDAIDNAPPVPQVTVFTENADEHAVADLKAELQNVLDDERPKGEWVDREYRRYLPRDAEPDYNDDTYDEKTHSVMDSHIVCSNCGAERHFYHKFCGNCGADMRTGDTHE